MGSCIEAVATARPHGLFGRGALHLSDEAGRACLARGHRQADELDLLVHVGIYKDHHVAEPALASIIQEDLGANPGHPPARHRHGTFSFDVQNGGCGVLTGLQLVDSFVGPGSARHGMVVAADADPSPRSSRGFRFRPAGAAVLLRHTDDARGFVRFAERTFGEHAGLFDARLVWHAGEGHLGRGRHVLEVVESPAFAHTGVELALEVVRGLLAGVDVRPGELDLLVASQYPRGFAGEVARGLGLPAERVPVVEPRLVATHTAGPLAALEAAIQSGRFAAARHTLLVSVGAGLTIAAALYRQPDVVGHDAAG